jgi:hypothetical protein
MLPNDDHAHSGRLAVKNVPSFPQGFISVWARNTFSSDLPISGDEGVIKNRTANHRIRHIQTFLSVVNICYRPNIMQSISGWDDYKISFVMSVCLFVWESPVSANLKRFRPNLVWRLRTPNVRSSSYAVYKSNINFRFYAAILDFGLLQH